MKSSLGHKTS